MSLPVPLTLRVGNQHVTAQAKALSFRKEAIGGLRSISFTLSRPLTDLDGLDPLAKVYVYDGRTAETVAEGRLEDTGRSAGTEGQAWECVAFGPAQAASDITAPLIYIDRDLGAWYSASRSRQELEFTSGSKPDGTIGNATGLVFTVEPGTTITTNDYADMRYERIREAGMELGGFSFNYDTGITAPDILVTSILSTDGNHNVGFYNNGPNHAWTTAGSTGGARVTTNFTNGRNVIDLRNLYTGAGGGVGVVWWSYINNVAVRSLLYTKAGVEMATTDYTVPLVYASDVVADLLGRGILDEFDGANALITTNTTTPIIQLAYPSGVTAEQVLTDLMKFEPAYRWTTGPDITGAGYQFRWELWPTTVRYEMSLDDGGSFPLSSQKLYNRVWVQYRDEAGVLRNVLRTKACAILDKYGLTRQGFIDLGNESGSLAQAQAAGDAFLDDHNVPTNAGSITTSRPIRDVIAGRTVQPWEIEPGELVRILGVEAYPDAFNADSNDGQGVFRIHAVDYNSDVNAATMALDSDPRTTEDALVALMKARERR